MANRPFYITGESYAGHYIPAVAHHIWAFNKAADPAERINLKGVAIGNGLCVTSSLAPSIESSCIRLLVFVFTIEENKRTLDSRARCSRYLLRRAGG